MTTDAGDAPQQLPPANLQAEQSLLGAILANQKAFDRVSEFLRPEHFSDPLHGAIYGEAARLIAGGKLADAVTLRHWYAKQPEAESAGPGYLAQLIGAMVGIVNAGDYGRVIYDAWMRRQIIATAEEMLAQAYAPDSAGAAVVANSIAALEATILRSSEQRIQTFDGAIEQAMANINSAKSRGGPAGITLGMHDVDKVIGGLEDDTMTILGGRPGMGKTALVMGWAQWVARNIGPVAMFSLEMSASQLARRALASAAAISIEKMKSGNLSAIDMHALDMAQQYLKGLPLFIEDAGGLTPQGIALRARMLKRKHGVKLFILDHLHIVKPEAADMKHGPTWGVGQASLALKNIAKDLRVPVLALAQLNRGLEGRDDKRPSMADLRQAGDIEQNADNIAFIYRPEYYMRKQPERGGLPDEKWERILGAWENKKAASAGQAELIIEKTRDGDPRTVPLRFDGTQTRFYQIDHGHDQI